MEATTSAQIFLVHCRGVDLKLTAKPKALLKPFKQTILEPFLKAYNPKAAKGEQMTFDDIEKVMVGPGFPYRSDIVPDWSVVTKTLVPPDADEEGNLLDTPIKEARVDILEKKDRSFCMRCCGLQFEADLPAKYVHLRLDESIVAQFFQQCNTQHKLELALTDIERVGLTNAGTIDEVPVDMTQPVWETLPRAGRPNIDIYLEKEKHEVMLAKFPPPKEEPEGGGPAKPVEQVFRVRCAAVELKLTLPAKSLSKSLRDGVISPFLRAYGKRAKRPDVSADDVLRVEADNTAVADSLRCSSLISGAPVVRVELWLRPPDEHSPAKAEDDEAERGEEKTEAASTTAGEPAAGQGTPGASGPSADKASAAGAGDSPEPTPPPAATAQPNAAGATEVAAASKPEPPKQVVPKPIPVPPKPALDYSKWANIKDDDDDDEKPGKKYDGSGGGKGGSGKGGSGKGGSGKGGIPGIPNLPGTRQPTVKKVSRRSYSDWDKLHIDSGDDDDDDDANALGGRLLLRDPENASCDWYDEAEALFGLGREQAFTFPLSYPRVKVEDGVKGRAGGGKPGEAAAKRVATVAAGIDELHFEVYPSQEHMPAGAYADVRGAKKSTRCILWMPTPHDPRVQGKAQTSQAAARTRQRKETTEKLLPAAPPEGLPLVVIAHGGLSHARGPHTLWQAWYLVREHGCAVLAVDHLPHHGVKTPYGSAIAEKWPDADLRGGKKYRRKRKPQEEGGRDPREEFKVIDGVVTLVKPEEEEHPEMEEEAEEEADLTPWSEDEWERTLRRSTSELGYALDIVLALPSTAEIARMNEVRRSKQREMEAKAAEQRTRDDVDSGRGASSKPEGQNDQSVQHWLQKLADRTRMRLYAQANNSDGLSMIDRNRVGFLGYGLGTTSGLPLLAADGAAGQRLRAAVLGFAADGFLGKELLKERSSGGLDLKPLDVPGSVPPPPSDKFAARMLECARKVRVPVHFVAAEKDERIPLDRAKALFDALCSGDEAAGGGPADEWATANKRWQMLPGARALTAAELADQMAWLVKQIAAAPPRPAEPPAPKLSARPVAPAGSAPSFTLRPSARSRAASGRRGGGARAPGSDGVPTRVGSPAVSPTAPPTQLPSGATLSLEERRRAARVDMELEHARSRPSGPSYPLALRTPGQDDASAAPAPSASAEVADEEDDEVDDEGEGMVDEDELELMCEATPPQLNLPMRVPSPPPERPMPESFWAEEEDDDDNIPTLDPMMVLMEKKMKGKLNQRTAHLPK